MAVLPLTRYLTDERGACNGSFVRPFLAAVAVTLTGLIAVPTFAAPACLPLAPKLVDVTGIVRVRKSGHGVDQSLSFSLELQNEITSCASDSRPGVPATSLVLEMGVANRRRYGPNLFIGDGEKVTLRGNLMLARSVSLGSHDSTPATLGETLQLDPTALMQRWAKS